MNEKKFDHLKVICKNCGKKSQLMEWRILNSDRFACPDCGRKSLEVLVQLYDVK